MAIARLVRQAKRPHGLWVKMTAVTILGLCFIFVWGVFSSSSTSVTTQRESFEDIAEPASSSSSHKPQKLKKDESKKHPSAATRHHPEQHKGKDNNNDNKEKKHVHKEDNNKEKGNHQGNEDPQPQHDQEEEKEKEKEEVEVEGEADVDAGGGDLAESVDQGDSDEAVEDVEEVRKASKGKGKVKGPLFDPNATYSWKLCSTRSKHNYIPCIDIEVGGGKVPSYRHTERSCPRTPFMCLVPLPHEGYESPLPWPESKLKVYEIEITV